MWWYLRVGMFMIFSYRLQTHILFKLLGCPTWERDWWDTVFLYWIWIKNWLKPSVVVGSKFSLDKHPSHGIECKQGIQSSKLDFLFQNCSSFCGAKQVCTNIQNNKTSFPLMVLVKKVTFLTQKNTWVQIQVKQIKTKKWCNKNENMGCLRSWTQIVTLLV